MYICSVHKVLLAMRETRIRDHFSKHVPTQMPTNYPTPTVNALMQLSAFDTPALESLSKAVLSYYRAAEPFRARIISAYLAGRYDHAAMLRASQNAIQQVEEELPSLPEDVGELAAHVYAVWYVEEAKVNVALYAVDDVVRFGDLEWLLMK